MSMSLDGYIAGPDDGPGNPGGDGFMRLHEWLATADGDSGRPPGPAGEMYDEMEATGAVLVGRRTAEQAGHYEGNHHGVPIVVVSHYAKLYAALRHWTETAFPYSDRSAGPGSGIPAASNSAFASFGVKRRSAKRISVSSLSSARPVRG
jgi:hypothetical protein